MKHQHHNSRRWQYRNRLSVFLSFFLPSFMYSIGVVQCVPQLRTNGLHAREAETAGHSGLQAGEQLLSTSLPYLHVITNHFTTANHRHIQGECTLQGQSGSITLSECRTTQLMEISTLDKEQSTTNRGGIRAENGTPGSIPSTPARTPCLSSFTNLNVGDRLSLTEEEKKLTKRNNARTADGVYLKASLTLQSKLRKAFLKRNVDRGRPFATRPAARLNHENPAQFEC